MNELHISEPASVDLTVSVTAPESTTNLASTSNVIASTQESSTSASATTPTQGKKDIYHSGGTS